MTLGWLQPAGRYVVLVRVWPRWRATGWILISGTDYYVDLSGREWDPLAADVTDVTVNGEAYTRVTSLTAAKQWVWDASVRRLTVRFPTGLNPNASTTFAYVTLKILLATDTFAGADGAYVPCIVQTPVLRKTLNDVFDANRIALDQLTLTLARLDREAFRPVARAAIELVWEQAALDVRVVGARPGVVEADALYVFSGFVERVTVLPQAVQVTASDARLRYDVQLPRTLLDRKVWLDAKSPDGAPLPLVYGQVDEAAYVVLAANALHIKAHIDAADGSANKYVVYSRSVSYTVQSGDYLEYVVAWNAPNIQVAAYLGFTDGTDTYAATDQNGYATSANIPDGFIVHRPYARKISLSAYVGKTISKFRIAADRDVVGDYYAVLTHAAITDGAGNVRFWLYGDGNGQPSDFAVEGRSHVNNTMTLQRAYYVAVAGHPVHHVEAADAGGTSVALARHEPAGCAALSVDPGQARISVWGKPSWAVPALRFTARPPGSALFDFVNVPHSASLNLSSAITLEARVYVTRPDAVGVDNFGTILRKDGAYLLDVQRNTRQFRFVLWFAGTPVVLSSPIASVPYNRWVHVAATYDGSAMRLYVDGQLLASQSQTGTFGTTTNPLRIGVFNPDPAATAPAPFDGLMDWVRVWSVARTQAQIQADMNNETPSTTTGLAALWKLNEGSGSTAGDSTANGNNGTINNAVWAWANPTELPGDVLKDAAGEAGVPNVDAGNLNTARPYRLAVQWRRGTFTQFLRRLELSVLAFTHVRPDGTLTVVPYASGASSTERRLEADELDAGEITTDKVYAKLRLLYDERPARNEFSIAVVQSQSAPWVTQEFVDLETMLKDPKDARTMAALYGELLAARRLRLRGTTHGQAFTEMLWQKYLVYQPDTGLAGQRFWLRDVELELESGRARAELIEDRALHSDFSDHQDAVHSDFSNHSDTAHSDFSNHSDTAHSDFSNHSDAGHSDFSNHSDQAHADFTDHQDVAHGDFSDHTDEWLQP